MPTEPIRVLLADDHAVVRKGIREFLTEPGDIEVIAEAVKGDKAIALLEPAKHVAVQLRFSETLSIAICDDGLGFAMPERVDALTDRGHFGLIGMRERAELIGARLTIHSSPGQGTAVEVELLEL